ncbi:MAG: NACHT domain-containing protein [Nostochopsis sp.]
MISIDLNSLISAITGIVNPTSLIKDKIQRSEIVIKLLKQFKLDPEHPPADFSGVYAYALVEYGVGKPQPVLELFREQEIKQAFRKAFDHNNPSILLSEVEAFVDACALGDEIKTLELDIRREVAAFATVFIEVAKRSRTPADVLMNQHIGSLHKRIAIITEQLDRLPTLEGIRTEIARLAAAEDAGTQRHGDAGTWRRGDAGMTNLLSASLAIALAQQMRGWFETLNYSFEKHEVWEDNYFEWIIHIPVRRNCFDRVLVRGIEGEAGLGDVMALRQSVETHKTDEGWLVTARRISRAARDEVDKEENRDLECFTFDELIDQDADFSGYVDCLEAEVKRREIDKKYVPLGCTKEEFDPVTKRRLGVSRYDQRDGWIDGYIDVWLDDPAKEHISILGEFGTGKTWFAFHYAWTALQRYRDAQKRGLERPRLPLVITLRDYARALNVENVLAGFFFTQHNIRLNSEVFDQLNRMGKLLLIFDGFDEMAAKVDKQQMINNFWELAKVVVPGSKVILTCRTEHFPEAKEGRALLNAELQASTANLTGETPQFEVLELEKFNDEQIRQVLSFNAEPATVEQVMGNSQLLDLARRPVMTELILEALPDIEAGKPVDMSRVYLYAVRHKMERDIKAERTFTSLADKLYFLCELSWEMLSTEQMSLNYRLFPDRIRRLFGAVVREEKDLDHWHFDMMGQTMLIRNADGDYTPAHRSLLEFFVAYKFAAELGVLPRDFTELAQAQSHLDTTATPQDYTWSSYFRRRINEAEQLLPIAPLKEFVSESLERLQPTFGQAPLTKAVMDLLVPMLDNYSPLLEILNATRGKTDCEVGYVGGNAATLLVKADKGALEGKNLSQAVIWSADFTNANLRHVNFADANLVDCVFTINLGDVWSVAFSLDNKHLAIADNNSVVRLWEVSRFREVLICKGHISAVSSVSFSPDGKILASCSCDQTVRLWNISTGECLRTLEGHNNWIISVAFSPDGNILASSGLDQTMKLWKVATGECLYTLQGHTGSIDSVAFSPDGKIIASCSSDQVIKLWKVATGECLYTLEGHSNWIKSIAFSPDGKILVSGSYDKTVKLWNIATGECLCTLEGHTNRVMSVAFSPSGEIVASGSDDQTVKLWNIFTRECLYTLRGHTNSVNSVAFSPNGEILASGGCSQIVKLWNIVTRECLHTLDRHTDLIYAIGFSLDSKIAAISRYDQPIKLWDMSTRDCLQTLEGHSDWVRSVAFSPDGKMLASGSHDLTVRVWNITTGDSLQALEGHSNWVRSVAFSPDGKMLASGSFDETVRLWDVATGECLYTLEGHISVVWSLAFSPNSKMLASGGDDPIVRVWNTVTSECLYTLQGHIHAIKSVIFSPDGKIVASGSHDRTVRVWDIATGKCLHTLQGCNDYVESLAFSPDSKTLASGSNDRTVRVWDITTGQCLHILLGHTNLVISVVFSPDGQTLNSGSSDGTVKLWDVKTGECLKTLGETPPYEGMNITGVKGLTEAEKVTLKALGAVEL